MKADLKNEDTQEWRYENMEADMKTQAVKKNGGRYKKK
jgi:post-segregation antitoxin (ccd killing protein)